MPGELPVAVISGNRNFPGRVHADLEAAFLASPPLVVAYALAGDANRNIATDPIQADVRLADLWPTGAEIDAALFDVVQPCDYDAAYGEAHASRAWADLPAPEGALYPWDPASTYLRPPPFATADAQTRLGRYTAHPLLVVGDDITTDHISPAGAVRADSEAARYLIERGEDASDLNVFSARRGNWEAMVRGLFTNRTVRNLLDPTLPPGQTRHAASGAAMTLWDAAEAYRQAGEAVVIVAGERYGMGSSRDWAAKGAALLGVRAVLAASFERIHRSNLVNMGVLPLRLPAGVTPQTLRLALGDRLQIDAEVVQPGAEIAVTVIRANGRREGFPTVAEVETRREVEVLQAGGMIPLILRKILTS